MSRARRIGTSFESLVVDYLREVFPAAERRALHGKNDRGDIAGTPYVVECKATRDIALASGMNELEVEIANAGVEWGFLVFKRRQRHVSAAYAVMSLEQLRDMLAEIEELRAQLRHP